MLVDATEEVHLALFSFFKLKMCMQYASHCQSYVEFEKLMPSHELCDYLIVCILLMVQA